MVKNFATKTKKLHQKQHRFVIGKLTQNDPKKPPKLNPKTYIHMNHCFDHRKNIVTGYHRRSNAKPVPCSQTQYFSFSNPPPEVFFRRPFRTATKLEKQSCWNAFDQHAICMLLVAVGHIGITLRL